MLALEWLMAVEYKLAPSACRSSALFTLTCKYYHIRVKGKVR